jgi:hypothetical protein
MESNPYEPPKSTTKSSLGKFKICGTGIGLSIAASAILLPATYLFGSLFFGKLFNQTPFLILAIVAVAIFYTVISKVCRIRDEQ